MGSHEEPRSHTSTGCQEKVLKLFLQVLTGNQGRAQGMLGKALGEGGMTGVQKPVGKGPKTPGSTSPLTFQISNHVFHWLIFPTTTYLFSHDSWLPNQTNESHKPLEEHLQKQEEAT